MHNRALKIFFSGIAGSGVSAIASFMADRGHAVAGSDRAFDENPDHPLKRMFQSRGIRIVPQDGTGIDSTLDLAVFSTAVEPDRPEQILARKLGIPLKTRPEYLTEITSLFRTIAVSGTSGKSTASGLLAFIMNRLGLGPNFIGGGRVKQFKSPVNPGNSITGGSDYLIFEACESDGSIVNYMPQHLIILNLALDHNPIENTAAMFDTLMQNTEQKIIMNADDGELRKLVRKGTVTFSLFRPSDYRPESIVYQPFGTDFQLHGTRFRIPLPGMYNLYNALSCIAFLSEIGIPPERIADILQEFKGIERRFDILLDKGKLLVIDDYAHNPHKISSLMETVKRLRDSICYIFQPHGFSPTRLMKKEYVETFIKNLRNSDHLILLPIFYAGGTADKDISSRDLADGITAGGKSAEVVEKRADILKMLNKHGSYIVLGARDETLSDLAGDIAGILSRG
jgi:UDP-N-acetylmuramate--alanine ligase